MNRREALALLTTIVGGTVFGAERLLAGVVNATRGDPSLFATDLALLNEIGETILPTTAGSAGAKAADVAAFMQEIVRDFYSDDEQTKFLAGPSAVQAASRAKFSGRAFESLDAKERFDLLMDFERADPQPEYYRMIKQLTLWGYFSSEVGVTQALNYLPVPGIQKGITTIEPGTKAWAE